MCVWGVVVDSFAKVWPCCLSGLQGRLGRAKTGVCIEVKVEGTSTFTYTSRLYTIEARVIPNV